METRYIKLELDVEPEDATEMAEDAARVLADLAEGSADVVTVQVVETPGG